ncbi:MAG TPA: alanine racemase [Streptosporangiaceae bacterium]|nr:alanine racemase [Streptosporangiaceae bacterium]
MVSVTPPAKVGELAVKLDVVDALPAYAYDLAALDAHAAAIRAALPAGVELYYAVKANPDAAVLRTVARHADGLEVSSGGELAHAAQAVPGSPLAFGGPGKTGAELARAIAAGTGRFHVESPHELRLLGAAAAAAGRPADVLLRVNPAPAPATRTALVMGGRASPFGMDPGLLGQCVPVLAELGGLVRPRGLHAHSASGLDADDLVAAAARLLAFGRDWCGRHDVPAPEFNLGGGMAVDYRRPDSVFDWERYGRGLAALIGPGETLRIEPGRAVTAYCGWYLTRVLDVKHSHGEAFAIIAGGTHHLRTPTAKGHDQPFAVIPVSRWLPDWSRPGTGAGPVTICGQLCTPKDVLAGRVPVGGVRAGDLIAFGLAGAYAWNISHQSFLMHPPPAFHYL